MRCLKQENRELRVANEILKRTSAFFAPEQPAHRSDRQFIDDNREEFGIEPIRRVPPGPGSRSPRPPNYATRVPCVGRKRMARLMRSRTGGPSAAAAGTGPLALGHGFGGVGPARAGLRRQPA